MSTTSITDAAPGRRQPRRRPSAPRDVQRAGLAQHRVDARGVHERGREASGGARGRHHPARPGVARCARAGSGAAGPRRRAPRPPGGADGLDDESLAAQALQEGAQDYLIKGQIETRGLLRALRYAIERKTMEEALFVEKERAQVTLNSIGDAVICTDISGNITFLNLVAEKMTGWSWQEAVGRPMAEVFRILDTTSRETIPNPMEMAVGQDRAGAPAVELHPHPARRIRDPDRRLRRPDPRPRRAGRPERSSSSAT